MRKELTKELLTDLYLTRNKSSGEIAKETGYGKTWVVKKLREFELTSLKSKEQRSKSKFDKIQQTNLERYGSISPFGNKEIQEKATKTILENYGVDHPTRSKKIREKIQYTCKNKYGSISPFGNKEIQEKVKQTNKERYGVDNVFKSSLVQERIQQILENKYYTSHASQIHLSSKTINLLNNKDQMQKYLESFKNKPTLYEIVKDLEISHSAINKKIREFELENLVNYYSTTSKYETEIKELLENWSIKVYKDRTILSPREIDLYCPDYKIGIEFNGNYWHSISNKGRNYHQKKSLLALEKEVFIYHIFEYEWLTKKDRIISQLRNLFGKNEVKIGARKCTIKELNPEEAKEFLNRNHLQGSDKAPIRLGLFYKEELVSIMTFGKPRFNKQYEYELLRFCCKANTTVVGAASKLFKCFIEKYKPLNIISYSNIAHTEGKLYSFLGFKQISISHPNYVWTRGEQVLTRYQCQRHKLIKQFPELKDLSETEIMTYLGYEKLEDAGNITWLIELSKSNI